jgi:1,4-alpha-glucan branching enzyme
MNIYKSIGSISVFLITCINYTFAQVVAINPAIATANDTVTITYDATLGNAALANATAVYAHTGLITSKSTSGTDWKYVQGNWGTDDAKVKMTSIGNKKFTLRYHIRTFYGLPQNELALKLSFVFRNLDGSVVGRDANGGDIFVDLSQGGYSVLFTTPSTPQVIKATDSLTVTAQSSVSSNLTLYIDGNVALQTTDSLITTKLAAATLGLGKHWLVIKGEHNTETAFDTTYVTVRPAAPGVGSIPTNCVEGINYINDSTVTLVLFAPNKSYVYVLGDFNNWQFDNTYFMTRNPEGNRFWITLTGLQPGKEYAFQYVIDDQQLRIADVYASKLLDPWNDGSIPAITYPNLKPYPAGKTSEVVSVLQTAQPQFSWQYSDTFSRPATDKMVVYELLIRDFIGRHDYQTLQDTLTYLKRLGVNTIELMPITEFEGNESWGYNISFYFAPDKYYGTREALKTFIDECHKQGFAVVLDMVLNHSFGQSPMVRMYFDPNAGQYGQPTAQNPWFNQTDKHPFGVGYDFNHESSATQLFVDTVIKYWLTEYKFDGFRFDLSKGFTQKNTGTDVGAWSAYDQSRINLWKRIMSKVRAYDSTAYMILEHLGDNSEEKVLSAEGFMLWGNLNHNFNEATMGYTGSSDLSWTDYKTRGWAKPNVVAYAESHDEERLMFKNITYGNNTNPQHKIKDTTIALKRIEAAMCLLIPLRGPKLIWQFGELGYDYSIDFNGRVGNKPIRWNYQNDSRRKRIFEVVSTLNNLKTSDDSLSTDNYTYTAGPTAIKTLVINSGTTKASIIANFGVTALPVVIQFPVAGTWYNVFGKDSIVLTGTTLNDTLAPGAYKVYINKPVETNYPTALNEPGNTNNWLGATVFPNPTDDLFSVYTGLPSSQPLNLEIYNLAGVKMNSFSYDQSPEYINLQASQLGLAKGMYLVKLSSIQSSKQFKLLIL